MTEAVSVIIVLFSYYVLQLNEAKDPFILTYVSAGETKELTTIAAPTVRPTFSTVIFDVFAEGGIMPRLLGLWESSLGVEGGFFGLEDASQLIPGSTYILGQTSTINSLFAMIPITNDDGNNADDRAGSKNSQTLRTVKTSLSKHASQDPSDTVYYAYYVNTDLETAYKLFNNHTTNIRESSNPLENRIRAVVLLVPMDPKEEEAAIALVFIQDYIYNNSNKRTAMEFFSNADAKSVNFKEPYTPTFQFDEEEKN